MTSPGRPTLLIAAACLLAMAPGGVSGQDLLADLRLPEGYLTLDAPRDFGGLPLPGALVELFPHRGFRYLGHLSACGLPESVLKPIPGLMGLPASARHGFKVSTSLGAKLLNLFSLKLAGDDTHSVEVTFGDGTDEMLVPLAVVSAAKANATALQQQCGDLLKQPNVFWINDAIKVSEMRIKLLNAAGAQVGGTADALGTAVSGLDAHAGVSVSSDGEIVIRRPVYIGFRDAPPAELLTGAIQLHSLPQAGPPPPVSFGDDVYGAP